MGSTTKQLYLTNDLWYSSLFTLSAQFFRLKMVNVCHRLVRYRCFFLNVTAKSEAFISYMEASSTSSVHITNDGLNLVETSPDSSFSIFNCTYNYCDGHFLWKLRRLSLSLRYRMESGQQMFPERSARLQILNDQTRIQ